MVAVGFLVTAYVAEMNNKTSPDACGSCILLPGLVSDGASEGGIVETECACQSCSSRGITTPIWKSDGNFRCPKCL